MKKGTVVPAEAFCGKRFSSGFVLRVLRMLFVVALRLFFCSRWLPFLWVQVSLNASMLLGLSLAGTVVTRAWMCMSRGI